MPLPVVPILIGIGIGCLVGSGAISAAVISHKARARKKLTTKPTGVPRPPPGMTRDELKRVAKANLGMNVTDNFNFAFCGASGAGKSTLINALLNREDVDLVEGKEHNMFGSAPTGVWQTTMTTLCYTYPPGHQLQHVRLWDTAGCGTHEHPSAQYFEDKALFAFDILMILADKELGEYEYSILEKAQKQQVPAVIVITKAEEKVESKIRKYFNSRNPPLEQFKHVVQETANEARQRVSACLQKRGLQNTSVFIVSAWKYRDFTVDHQQTGRQRTNLNQETCEDDSFSREVSDREANDHDTGEEEADRPMAVEDEAHVKTALLSFELAQLLEYMANAAIYRRL